MGFVCVCVLVAMMALLQATSMYVLVLVVVLCFRLFFLCMYILMFVHVHLCVDTHIVHADAQAMRRFLPVTRKPMDWNSNAHKLAQDLSK